MSLTFREKLVRYPCGALRLAIVLLNNVYSIPTYVIWMMLLLPLKSCNSKLYYQIEGKMYHWMLSIVGMWSYTAGYNIVESGDDINKCLNSRTVVIANHQSTSDVPLMMAAFSTKPDVLPNIMWIMDRLFKYTNFGVVSLIHHDFFISSGKTKRERSILELKAHLKESFLPIQRNWMVLFPEGGFLRKRKEISNRFARKNGWPELDKVSLPRVGALKAILEVLPPHSLQIDSNSNKNSPNGNDVTSNHPFLDYILDVTIAYPDGKPIDLAQIVFGFTKPCQIHFLYRVYHTSEVPLDNEELSNWVIKKWIEKESLLETFYKTGRFDQVHSTTAPTLVQQDILRLLLIHLFFITSTYLHYQIFYIILSYWNQYVNNIL